LQHSHILTPHLGEFRALAKDLSLETREEASRTFSQRWPATLLLKGSRTLITNAGSTLWCNTTGHAGMATAGQGDALAGVIGALLAGGGTTIDSACFGAWLCGRAAEIATQEFDCAEESLITTDVIENLGNAWQDWRRSTR
jgi:NAD(P)H-hydrate epimerase